MARVRSHPCGCQVRQPPARMKTSAERDLFAYVMRIVQKRRRFYLRKSRKMKKQKIKEHARRCAGLSDDFIAVEILTRLPVKSVLRCKLVCKSWCSLISDPSFVASYLDRARERPQLVILTSINTKQLDIYGYDERGRRRTARLLSTMEFRKEQETLYPPQHCNGLLLLNTEEQLLVCNPSTREVLALPEGSQNALTWGRDKPIYRAAFGFVPCINVFKVAQYFYRWYDFTGQTCSIGFEVLTLGEDFSWRAMLEDPPYPIANVSPKSVGESVYFRISNSLHSSSPKAFLSFSLRYETFRVIDPPSCGITDHHNMSIEGLEGDIPCLVHWSHDRMKYDFWISKDCGNHVWIPIFSINLLQPVTYILPVAIRHEKLLLSVDDHGSERLEYYNPCVKSFELVAHIAKDLAFYNQQKGSLNLLAEKTPFQVMHYVESLVSLRPGR